MKPTKKQAQRLARESKEVLENLGFSAEADQTYQCAQAVVAATKGYAPMTLVAACMAILDGEEAEQTERASVIKGWHQRAVQGLRSWEVSLRRGN